MFSYFNIFDFFSRYTYRSFNSYQTSSSGPALSQAQSPATTEQAPATSPDTNQPAPVEETPSDTIELSGQTPENAEEKPVYTAEDIVPAEDTPQEAAPAEENPEEVVPAEEGTEEPAPADNGPELLWSKSRVKVNLSMMFNMAEFDAIVNSFAEDAEDGEIDSVSYSNLNIGLHTELSANARVKEIYKDEEGSGGSLQYSRSNQRMRSRHFDRAMLRSRGFEADMFYRESMKASSRIRESHRHGFLKVSQKLHMRYRQDFRLNLRALNLFNGQAEALDQADNLGAYLNNTEALVDSPNTSGAMIGSFFDMVQGYLDGAEDQLMDKVNSFFENLASEMGVGSEFLDGAQETMVSNIADFFDRVDSAIELSRNRYLPPTEEPAPELPEIPEEPVQEPVEEPIVENVQAEAA